MCFNCPHLKAHAQSAHECSRIICTNSIRLFSESTITSGRVGTGWPMSWHLSPAFSFFSGWRNADMPICLSQKSETLLLGQRFSALSLVDGSVTFFFTIQKCCGPRFRSCEFGKAECRVMAG